MFVTMTGVDGFGSISGCTGFFMNDTDGLGLGKTCAGQVHFYTWTQAHGILQTKRTLEGGRIFLLTTIVFILERSCKVKA